MIRLFALPAIALAALLTAGCDGDGPVDPGIPAAPKTQQIAAGTQHVCMLNGAGEVFCWGNDGYGAVGQPLALVEACRDNAPRGIENSCSRFPRRVGGDTLRLRAITAGEQSTCGITPDGRAVCWGDDVYSLFGTKAPSTCSMSHPCHFAPVALPFPQRWKQLSIGRAFPAPYMCGVSEAGEGFCWGSSDGGRLGDGRPGNAPNTFVASPQPVAGGHRFREIVTGQAHTCGLTLDGKVYCWGFNDVAELGTRVAMDTCEYYSGGKNSTLLRAPCTGTPTAVQTNATFVDIAASSDATCGVTTTGELLCWGAVWGLEGRAGGSFDEAVQPRATFAGARYSSVEMPISIPASQILCAMGTDRAVYCRGRNHRGQLGNGTTMSDSYNPEPTRVAGTDAYAGIAVAAAGGCGITTGGGVNCWGDNDAHTLARPGVAFDPNPGPIGTLVR